VLVCAAEAPLAPYGESRLQLRALVDALALRHEVHVVAALWPGQEITPTSFGMTLVPAPSRAADLPERLRPIVAGIVESSTFDVVHVVDGELAELRPALAGLPAILMPLAVRQLQVDAEAVHAHGPRRRLLSRRLRHACRHAQRWYPEYSYNVLSTEADADVARITAPLAHVQAIAGGVDAAWFSPVEEPAEPGLVVFAGILDHEPHVRAAQMLVDEVLPLVRERHPHAHVALVGRDPSAKVQALAGPHVDVRETADPRPWLRRAAVFACPVMTGTGAGTKLLEAMACGAASVVMPQVGESIGVVDGRPALVAEGPGAVAGAVGRLLSHPLLCTCLGLAGRRCVEEEHGWDRVAGRYELLYAQAIGL
jgi:glycosyltransferase involved in cell wall biosynthesis